MKSGKNRAHLKVLRYNPLVDETPYYQDFSVPLTEEKTNLLQALEFIYHEEDHSLTFRRYSCGLQFCNSCLMLINGRPAHACLTILEPGTHLEVAPLPGRRVLRDLITEDRG